MVFSKEQKSAIHFKDGPALVLAGPGSGKTTVIVNRIISLIKEHSVSPSSILVITFTKAAAKSMRQRFLSLTGESYVSVTFGTFHAVFFSMLLPCLQLFSRFNNKSGYTVQLYKKCSYGL